MSGKLSPMLRRLRRRVLLGNPVIRLFARWLPTSTRQHLASATGMYDVHRYQDYRDPTAKAMLITEFLRGSMGSHRQSVLDIGCNAGEVTRYLNNQGFLTVGIDRREVLARVPSGGRHFALIPFEVDSASVPRLPSFDCVLLLSVHHQWVATNGDATARELVRLLSGRAERTMVIEFSSLNAKYGHTHPELFDDNTPSSVIEYAVGWLATTLPNFVFSYLGLNEEHPVDEPYRVLFGGTRIEASDSDSICVPLTATDRFS
jgi:SAM-dependent methyltransferase